MTTVEHALPPEELMAYLDGELAQEKAVAVHAHLVSCAVCQALAAELGQVSQDMAHWQVEQPATPLRAPAGPIESKARGSRWPFQWRRPAVLWQFAGAAAVVVLIAVVWVGTLSRTSDSVTGFLETRRAEFSVKPAEISAGGGGAGATRARVGGPSRTLATAAAEPEPAGQPQGSTVSRPSKVIRTVTLMMVVKDFDAVRPALDRMLRDVNGYMGELDASGARDATRTLRATLRVPAQRLDETVRALRSLGHVAQEVQSGDDVTDQVVDIETRLVNGRNTEKRLNEVLKNRTGNVSDVLEVEREIARVRAEIERLVAERTNLERRVTYATVTLQATEERQATLDIGPLPLSARLRNALVDGLRDAFESAVGAVLVGLRIVPLLLLWVAVLWWPARLILRATRVPRS